MRIEGVAVEELAERVGTPFYVYSAAAITSAYERWRAAFATAGFGDQRHRTCFAVKANSALAVLRHLALAGADFDVVSAGELHRVVAVGGRADRVVFSGPGKSDEDLQHAVARGVGLINVEAPAEIARLAALAAGRGAPLAIGLRVNPDLDPKTHPAIATGPRQTKFGLAPEEIDELLADDAWRGALEVRAVAVHIGSLVSELEPMAEAARQALAWAVELRRAGHPIDWIDIGGGLAIAYDDDARIPTPEEFAARIGEELASWDGGLITEPGRVIVAAAGWLVTRVTVMRQRGDRGLLVCDAGMNALLRPALYGSRHRVEVVGGEGAAEEYDVMGPLCESGDVLARGARLRGAAPGALLAVRDAGAYGFVMSSEYNTHPRPTQVLVDDGRWAIITPRPTFEQMLAAERLAPWQPAPS